MLDPDPEPGKKKFRNRPDPESDPEHCFGPYTQDKDYFLSVLRFYFTKSLSDYSLSFLSLSFKVDQSKFIFLSLSLSVCLFQFISLNLSFSVYLSQFISFS